MIIIISKAENNGEIRFGFASIFIQTLKLEMQFKQRYHLSLISLLEF